MKDSCNVTVKENDYVGHIPVATTEIDNVVVSSEQQEVVILLPNYCLVIELPK